MFAWALMVLAAQASAAPANGEGSKTAPSSPILTAEVTPPVPRGYWLSSDDYPKQSAKRHHEGVTYIAVRVDAEGMPLKCLVTKSSGWPELDELTCQLQLRRGRFLPARDGQGAPVVGVWAGRARWILPRDDGPDRGKPRILDPLIPPYSLVPDSFRKGQ